MSGLRGAEENEGFCRNESLNAALSGQKSLWLTNAEAHTSWGEIFW